ncbi:MAG: hypothetical protein WCC10_07310 [Tumebacillaceae bacterium]
MRRVDSRFVLLFVGLLEVTVMTALPALRAVKPTPSFQATTEGSLIVHLMRGSEMFTGLRVGRSLKVWPGETVLS